MVSLHYIFTTCTHWHSSSLFVLLPVDKTAFASWLHVLLWKIRLFCPLSVLSTISALFLFTGRSGVLFRCCLIPTGTGIPDVLKSCRTGARDSMATGNSRAYSYAASSLWHYWYYCCGNDYCGHCCNHIKCNRKYCRVALAQWNGSMKNGKNGCHKISIALTNVPLSLHPEYSLHGGVGNSTLQQRQVSWTSLFIKQNWPFTEQITWPANKIAYSSNVSCYPGNIEIHYLIQRIECLLITWSTCSIQQITSTPKGPSSVAHIQYQIERSV